MYMKAKKGWPKHIDFTIIDILGLELALITAYFIRIGIGMPRNILLYETLAVMLPLLHIAIIFFTEGY